MLNKGNYERRKTFRCLLCHLIFKAGVWNTNDTNKGKGFTPMRELSASYSRIMASFPDFALRETRASAQYVIYYFQCFMS